MSQIDALKLISDLSRASIRAYAVANGLARGNPKKAAQQELKAARALYNRLGDMPVTTEQLSETLGTGV